MKNSGNDRVIDELRKDLAPQATLDMASPACSLFAYAEIQGLIEKLVHSRFVLPTADGYDLNLLGSEADRSFRNRLQARWIAHQCADWINNKAEVRGAPTGLPRSTLIAGHSDPTLRWVITGNSSFTTEGFGLSEKD